MKTRYLSLRTWIFDHRQTSVVVVTAVVVLALLHTTRYDPLRYLLHTSAEVVTNDGIRVQVVWNPNQIRLTSTRRVGKVAVLASLRGFIEVGDRTFRFSGEETPYRDLGNDKEKSLEPGDVVFLGRGESISFNYVPQPGGTIVLVSSGGWSKPLFEAAAKSSFIDGSPNISIPVP